MSPMFDHALVRTLGKALSVVLLVAGSAVNLSCNVNAVLPQLRDR